MSISGDQFRLFVEHTPAAVAIFDLDMKYVSVSRRWLLDYGLAGKNIIGKSHYDIFPEIRNMPHWIEVHRRCLKGKIEKCEGDKFVRADGSVRWENWEMHPWHTDSGEIGGIILFSEDVTARRQLEQFVQEKELMLKTFMDNSGAVAFMKDSEGKYVYGNSVFEKLFNLKIKNIIGKTDYDFLAKEVADEIGKNDKRVISTGESIEIIESVPTADGKMRVWLVHKFRFENLFGKRMVGGVAFDITPMKEIEASLEEKERFLSTLIGNLSGMVYRCKNDPSWTLYYVSEGCFELTGYTVDDFTGQRVRYGAQIIHPDDRESVWESVQKALENNEPFHLTYRIITSAIQEKWVWEQGCGVYDENGELMYLEGFIADMTHLKKLNLALEESEKRYRQLVESSKDLIWSVDEQGRWTFINRKAAETIYGYSPEEMLGRPFTDFETPYQAALDWKVFEEIKRGHSFYDYETVHMRKDGHPVHLSFTASPVRNAEGSVIGTTGTGVDITERKRLDKLKEDFISTISHELRTPLAIMDVAIGNLAKTSKGTLLENESKILDVIKRNCDRLNILVSDILDVSRLESGKMKLNVQKIDFGKLFDEILSNFQKSAEENKILLQAELSPDLGSIHADESMMIQVLNNLVSNAIRYASSKVLLKAVDEGPAVKISVEDDGIGISKQDIGRLFKKFEQINRPVGGAGYKGTGLGLVIVKQIIDLHHGKVWVESEKNKGSAFYFLIPKGLRIQEGSFQKTQVLEEETSVLRYPRSSGAIPRKKVLIIDDEKDLVDVLLIRLQVAGCLVEAALDGKTGLEKARNFKPDIVLLDIVMPQMDGWEVCRLLRESHDTRNVPVVIFTAGDLSKSLERAKHVGANRVIQKPFQMKDINDILEDPLITLENRLKSALEKNELIVFYQPQVELAKGSVVGMEALLRWKSPEEGLISPKKFIPIAEESGLIIEIGRWVLNEACRQNKFWQNSGYPHIHVAVNLSAKQFQQSDLIEMCEDVLKESGLDAKYLELEVTESVAMDDAALTVDTLLELKRMGIKVAIDDFGTGYSSLKYLKLYSIDKLKIDQSFVQSLAEDPSNTAITRAIISMAHQLNLETVAEGVETRDQLKYLRDLKCDIMQGFLFSRPLPVDQATRLLSEKRVLQF